MPAESGMAQVYIKDIHKQWKNLYANWPPNGTIVLGDYGFLDKDGLFEIKGNIKLDGFVSKSIRINTSSSEADYKYSSKGCSFEQLKTNAEGKINQVANLNASLEIKFERDNSIFLNAAGCKIHSIENIPQIEKEIIWSFKGGSWNPAYAIITKLVEATSSTLIISSSDKASITLEAGVDIPKIDLANAALELSVKSQQNIGFQAIMKGNLVPLFGCHKLRCKWFGEPELEASNLVTTSGESDEEDMAKVREMLIREGKSFQDELELVELGEKE